MYGVSLAEYGGTVNQDEKYLANIFLRENISCTSKIDLSYYFDYYAIAIVCTCRCVGAKLF